VTNVQLQPSRYQTAQRSLALARVDSLIGKAFSVVALISGFETVANALPQANHFNPWVFYLTVGSLLLVQVLNVVNFWFGSASLMGYVAHAAVVMLLMLTWPIQHWHISEVPLEHKPWLWWATGIASMAIGFHIPKWWAWVYMAAMPVVWFWIRTQPSGGSAPLGDILQEAAFATLFPATVVALAQLLRSSAARVDQATILATDAAAERSRLDAVERERSRIDALVHDSVLTTLIVAANAQTEEQQQAAKRSAELAIKRLEAAAVDDSKSEAISVLSFFQALGESILRIDPRCEVSATGATAKPLAPEVVAALTDATAQALSNSLAHAGRKATRKVRLKASEREIKIVVTDDGVGFRPSRVPKNRLGLRISIIERVEAIGGRVYIDSRIGQGTSIIMEWDVR
jgi:signal transduction histidine kinase